MSSSWHCSCFLGVARESIHGLGKSSSTELPVLIRALSIAVADAAYVSVVAAAAAVNYSQYFSLAVAPP